MSHENVELHRQGYEAWNRGDRESWLALAGPDVELILPGVQMMEGGGALRGEEGADRVWHALHATFPDFHFDVEEIRDLGERTFAKVRLRRHGAGSDAPLDQQAWHLMKWRHRKLHWFHAFLNETEALEAAGLRE
jgi:ketosteroid isomerase-like protein